MSSRSEVRGLAQVSDTNRVMQVIGRTTVGWLPMARLVPEKIAEFASAHRRGNVHIRNSIRINDQYRLCFRWTPEGPDDVELVDYH